MNRKQLESKRSSLFFQQIGIRDSIILLEKKKKEIEKLIDEIDIEMGGNNEM